MKIIKFQESYGAKRLRRLLPAALFLLGLLVLVAIFFLFAPSIPGLMKHWLIIIITSFAVMAFAKNLLEPLIDDIRNFQYGEEGEKMVAEILGAAFDDDYTYIANYVIPNTRIGDIDGLLIGQKGIIILEIKNYAGDFKISGGDMLRKLRRDIYKLYHKSPFRQAIQQKRHLENFLRAKSINIRVLPVVVLVTGRIITINGETGAFITEVDNLASNILKLSPIPNWSTELSNKIIAALGLEKTSEKPILGQF